MRFRFRVAPRAATQIRSAARWWLDNRPAASTLLAEEIEAAYALIEELPFAGEAVPHVRITELRRVLLGRTQYHLYYSVDEDIGVIEVLALWHTSRGTRPTL